MKEFQYKKILLRTLKIALGSSTAIFIASAMGLQFAASSGIITLLTIVTTKWETVKLSVFRMASFGISAILAGIIFPIVRVEWISFGIYVFCVVIICTLLQWQATISVNVVIGTHFFAEKEYTLELVKNEFCLVVIGISIAVVLNLFHGNKSHKEKIIQSMRYTESKLQMILEEVAAYLDKRELQRDVWVDIRMLEKELHHFVDMAYEYQDNTFYSHPEYYIDYFEMRTKQCNMLHNLQQELKKIQNMPKQARIVAEYILYLVDYVVEMNDPREQMEKLGQIFAEMKEEPLPVSAEEFESRALLYHILMDLEEFLTFKKRFVESLDEPQKERYWRS